MKNLDKMIIYQLFPRLFGNDNSTNKLNGTIDENGVGKFSKLSDKALKEISKMGITHVWYTGIIEHATKTDYSDYGIKKDHSAIVKGNAGSPYAIKDYYDVDPDLADDVSKRMLEFESLVERTHNSGMKVIIDFVPNHVARQYCSDAKPEGTVDLGEMDDIHTTFNSNNNFYYIPGQSFSPEFSLIADGERYLESPAKATGNDCFNGSPSYTDWYETIKLNYGIDYLNGGIRHFDPIPDTWTKMLQILMFWASKKVDGLRCDMAEMVPVDFWAWAIPQVKMKYPAIIFIAEIYNPDQYRNYIWNGKFDYLYDKVGLYDTLKAVITNKLPASSITSCWQSIEGIQHQLLNFLENHDEQRIASDFFAKDPWKAIPAMVVAATINTSPVMIYCGQELGEAGMDVEGFSGLDGRTSIFDYWSVKSIRDWCNEGKFDGKNLTKKQKELRNFYIQLLNLCNKEKAIKQGIFYDLMYVNYENPQFNSEKQFAYIRQLGKEIILVVANFDDHYVRTSLFLPFHAFQYMKIEPISITSGKDLFSGETFDLTVDHDSCLDIAIQAHGVRMIKLLSSSR